MSSLLLLLLADAIPRFDIEINQKWEFPYGYENMEASISQTVANVVLGWHWSFGKNEWNDGGVNRRTISDRER